MKVIYQSCQSRFHHKLPAKNLEEIYKLVVGWYEDNHLIDSD